uniref:Uncharacterized protein n=1 Tax=Otus sunia TaxID=257818 RepID=A0A8C8B432_9STRI
MIAPQLPVRATPCPVVYGESSFTILFECHMLHQSGPQVILCLSAWKTLGNQAFHSLKKLQHVDLSNNKLIVFSTDAFSNLKSIYLNFAHNRICIVPCNKLASLAGHCVINLSYNPLDCTCSSTDPEKTKLPLLPTKKPPNQLNPHPLSNALEKQCCLRAGSSVPCCAKKKKNLSVKNRHNICSHIRPTPPGLTETASIISPISLKYFDP